LTRPLVNREFCIDFPGSGYRRIQLWQRSEIKAIRHDHRTTHDARRTTTNPDTRHHVHALVDRLPPVQLAAVETLLQFTLDPLSLRLAVALFDGEPFTEEDSLAVAEAEEWSKHN
jgi:hypothetical protein